MTERSRRVSGYPRWIYYPRSEAPPAWASSVVSVFAGCQSQLDTALVHNKSDAALQMIRPGLEEIGFKVEGGTDEPTIYRPVHFGEFGQADRQFHIDSYHDEWKAGLEVEAGRSIRGNAIYRDLIQASLIVGMEYFVLAIPQRYRFQVKSRQTVDAPYEFGLTVLDAVYSSARLKLPLKGLLFIGF